ncbi:antibiotic biosynthesis monooxygenase [Planctomicrobium sp. SH664]|uniref:antibiotic biosynthesis monooxygenase n=1 Tax=Planctomicrobium sp. SH664 TaxID=3448125 RepID=UPI003F5C2F32
MSRIRYSPKTTAFALAADAAQQSNWGWQMDQRINLTNHGAMIVYRLPPPMNSDRIEVWENELHEAVALAEGFLDQAIVPPSPPSQPQWIVVQWFQSTKNALKWLNSPARLASLESASASDIEIDEVDIVPAKSPQREVGVSVLITTKVKPGQELAYQQWQKRIARAHANAPGFCGYRFTPPHSPGTRDWLVILRFDTLENLQRWIDSPVRKELLDEASTLTEETKVRMTRSAFDEWFQIDSGSHAPPEWKMSMLVLLVLYPLVFLFDKLLSGPVLAANGVPPWLAIFLGNVFCVTVLSQLIPWAGRRFRWWLEPPADRKRAVTLQGAVVVIIIYLVTLTAFALWSS